MKTICWARYGSISHRVEISMVERDGFRPLVYRDSKPAPVYSREVVERMARELGWTPPADQQAEALDVLKKHPLGVDFGTLCALIGRSLRTVKAIMQPLRKAGKVRLWPRKGPGCVWYATENEAAVLAAFEARKEAMRSRDREQAVIRDRKKRRAAVLNMNWRAAA